MDQLVRMFAPFFHPDLSPAYVMGLVPPTLATLALALGAMTLTFLVSVPLAIAVVIRLPGFRAVAGLLTLIRAIPDLTLAILCVILFGIGPGAALVALVIYYVAAVSKVFADILDAVPERAIDALRATGASPLQIACFARLPLGKEDIFTYGAFAFECCLRSSVIVGAVGGGGLGAELIGSLAIFDFARAATQIILLVIVIATLDHIVHLVRRRPRTLIIMAPLGLIAAWTCRPDFIAISHTLSTLREMLPPTLDRDAISILPRLIAETVAIALAGTAGAALFAVPAAMLASRRFAAAPIRIVTRRLLDVLRAVPEVVWGLVLVAAAGVGPVAGAWALGLHSFGSLGRIFADTIDGVPEGPQQALAATGASRTMIACFATLPLARDAMAINLLFRLEWNLRMATVLGVIGAGGIGQALYQAQQLFFYPQVLAYVLITAVIVLSSDRLSSVLRRRLRMQPQRAGACAPHAGALAL